MKDAVVRERASSGEFQFEAVALQSEHSADFGGQTEKTRVAVSEFPKDRVSTFPPAYSRSVVVGHRGEDEQKITIANDKGKTYLPFMP